MFRTMLRHQNAGQNRNIKTDSKCFENLRTAVADQNYVQN